MKNLDKYTVSDETFLAFLIINFILSAFLKSNIYTLMSSGVMGIMFILCGNGCRKRKETFDFWFNTILGLLTCVLFIIQLIQLIR